MFVLVLMLIPATVVMLNTCKFMRLYNIDPSHQRDTSEQVSRICSKSLQKSYRISWTFTGSVKENSKNPKKNGKIIGKKFIKRNYK